ncbi:hypothetical protein PMZ80_003916 [Knufia obscura]|uniref:Endonuclease/exonuclease/phosphatase domain-containing protein n=2 Tax=Knufia TaxID=430999 RepID=A0AAN8EKX9_9EURO|nr:hypothetical protein PMZ80_003916 [Knufia obscura]KAK5958169.1 hypothetical protein OHC33_000010 [Knufia fluminis]
MGGGDHHPAEHALHRKEHADPALALTPRTNDITTHAKSGVPDSSAEPTLLRLITHNVRYAATELFPHERPWPERLPNLLRQFHHYAAGPFNPPSTIICLQEVLQTQLEDLVTAFGGEWTHMGVGRDDGKEGGEFNPIFYRRECWKQVHFETVWLSETPDQPGLGWDAGSNRICTCLVLQSKQEGRGSGRIIILNTHLDNAGQLARRNGAMLILEYTRRWQEKFKADHILLAGDLNSIRDEEHGAWKVLNARDSGFVDVERLLGPADVRRFGDKITFTGFDGSGDDDPPGTLDFIHYGIAENETVAEASRKLQSYSVVPNLFDDGVRCSDHRAVVVDLQL